MEINSKPRIIIWFVSNDGRYIGNALNILAQQHNGIEILGTTATQQINVNNLPFIPLNEINLNGGGMTSSLLPVRVMSACQKLRNLQNKLILIQTNF
ncbi:MAG: hypothetical protein IKZ58_02670 [Selenomonadaceae bacterium]|nr:hypothetical protein [Selenomonadaceae bacterium]